MCGKWQKLEKVVQGPSVISRHKLCERGLNFGSLECKGVTTMIKVLAMQERLSLEELYWSF